MKIALHLIDPFTTLLGRWTTRVLCLVVGWSWIRKAKKKPFYEIGALYLCTRNPLWYDSRARCVCPKIGLMRSNLVPFFPKIELSRLNSNCLCLKKLSWNSGKTPKCPLDSSKQNPKCWVRAQIELRLNSKKNRVLIKKSAWTAAECEWRAAAPGLKPLAARPNIKRALYLCMTPTSKQLWTMPWIWRAKKRPEVKRALYLYRRDLHHNSRERCFESDEPERDPHMGKESCTFVDRIDRKIGRSNSWSMYMSMCVCVCVCECVCECCARERKRERVCVCVLVRASGACVLVCARIDVCMCVCVNVCECEACLYNDIHTHLRTHTHIYIFICMNSYYHLYIHVFVWSTFMLSYH